MRYGRISWLKDEFAARQLGQILGSRLVTDGLPRLLLLSLPPRQTSEELSKFPVSVFGNTEV